MTTTITTAATSTTDTTIIPASINEAEVATIAGEIDSLVKCAQKLPGRDVDSVIGKKSINIHLMLRWSRSYVFVGDKLDPKRYKSLDVVQIGWIPFTECMAKPLSAKPKGSALSIWNTLKLQAKNEKRVLKVESVLDRSGKFKAYLKRLGFESTPYNDNDMVFIPEGAEPLVFS
jgi:hypothetical protein